MKNFRMEFIVLLIALVAFLGCGQSDRKEKAESGFSDPYSKSEYQKDVPKEKPAPALPKSEKAEYIKSVPLENPEKVVAVVNGEKITNRELIETINQTLSGPGSIFGPPKYTKEQIPELKGATLESLAKSICLVQAAVKAGYSLSDSEYAEKRNEYIERSGGEKNFGGALEQMGMTEEKFDEVFREQVLVEKYMNDQIKDLVKVDEEGLRKMFESQKSKFQMKRRVKAAHIFLPMDKDVSESDKAAIAEKLEAIRKRALAGEDFGKLAEQYSEESLTKANKGSLGWVQEGQEPYFTHAEKLEVGEISEVWFSDRGAHIITAYEKKDAGTADFEEKRDFLEAFQEHIQKTNAQRDLMDRLLKESQVEYNIPMPTPKAQKQGLFQ